MPKTIKDKFMIHPLLSIITVVRNDNEHIAATMKSVLGQTYPNVEYIILDGASTDDTMKRIHETVEDYAQDKEEIELGKEITCANGKTVTVISEPDKGVYDAMNKGIAMSHGAWLNFMNSGDTFHSDTVLEDMKFDEVEWEDAVLYADASVTYCDGVYLEKPKPFFETYFRFKGIGICHQTMFFPGEIARTMKHNLKYRIAADYDFANRLYKAGYPFLYRPVTVVDYTWGDGISSNPKGLIPVYKENARVAEQTWNPFYWAFYLRECWRLWKKRNKD